MTLLSIVVPCFNEEETVDIYYEAVTKVLNTMDLEYEIIFVNDGSRDRTLEKTLALHDKYPKNVKVVDFSRNFGKEGALLAGLRHTKGDYVTVMDADLQDPPEYLPKMFEVMEKNNDDVVGTRRVTRVGEPVIRSFFARQFYKLINHFCEVEIVDGARDYRLMKRQVVDSILSLNEYTNAPLEISFVFGGFLTFVTTIELIILLITSLCGKVITTATILISLILFIGGCILLAIGILGEYMAKTYSEVKGRPQYIVRKFYD